MTNQGDYFRTFCRISQAFGATKNKEELLPLIVESAIDTMNGKAACLFLLDEAENLFIPVSQKGLSPNYLHSNPVSAKRLVSGITKDGHFAFKDATTDPRLEHHEAKKAEGIASILTVPVIADSKVIGILSLYTSTPRDFTADEIDFLKALAEQGGLAIKHMQLLELIRRNTSLFLDLSAAINSSLDIKQVLHHLTESIAESLGMKGATIRLLDKENKNLVIVADYGLSEEYLKRGPLTLEKGLAMTLAGEPVVIEDVETDKRIEYRKETLKEGIHAVLSVPMKSKGKVIGVMRLFSARKQKFPRETVELFSALAHHGAMAIENASAYMSLEDDIKGLREDIWSHRSWF